MGSIFSNLPVKKTEQKVLVIGIDAFDPKIVNLLMAEGKLPNFEKLSNLGHYSELQTTIPPETPVAWSAAATGLNPGNFGIFDFFNRDARNYLPKLNLAEEKTGLLKTEYENARKGIAFWDITSKLGIPTTIIRWPVTFPASNVNGKMLSGLGVVDIRGWLNSYRFYSSENYNSDTTGFEKIIKIEKTHEINTKIFGPFKLEGGKRVEIETPMIIKPGANGATLIVNGKEYYIKVNDWSDWIKVEFKIGFLRSISGIFKVYLFSTEPEFNMYMSSIQIDPMNPLHDISYPKDYAKELAEDIGLFYTAGMPEETKAVTDGRMNKSVFMKQIFQIEEERTKMFWHEFENFQKLDSGVYAFGFDAGDRMQHIMWEDKVLKNDGFKIPREIEQYYIDKDNFLGEVLDRLDENTKLIIFSDHGFTSFERAVNINKWLVDNGYLVLTKEPTEKDSGGLFQYVDWSRTKAYSMGFTSIYINLEGRESDGIVKNEDKEEIINNIINGLKELKDTETNQKIITNLYKGSEIYSGEYQKDAPDIVIGFNESYRMSWQNAAGGTTPWIIEDNKEEWSGDHLMDRNHVPAVLFTNFKIQKNEPDLIDIAPTILKLLDIEIPEEMDGKSLI